TVKRRANRICGSLGRQRMAVRVWVRVRTTKTLLANRSRLSVGTIRRAETMSMLWSVRVELDGSRTSGGLSRLQTVGGLFPEIRRDHQLNECLDSGDRHNDPVKRR